MSVGVVAAASVKRGSAVVALESVTAKRRTAGASVGALDRYLRPIERHVRSPFAVFERHDDFFAVLCDELMMEIARWLSLADCLKLARCSRRWTRLAAERTLLPTDSIGHDHFASPHYRCVRSVGDRLTMWRVLCTGQRFRLSAANLNYSTLRAGFERVDTDVQAGSSSGLDEQQRLMHNLAPELVYATVYVDGAVRRIALGLADLEHLELLQCPLADVASSSSTNSARKSLRWLSPPPQVLNGMRQQVCELMVRTRAGCNRVAAALHAYAASLGALPVRAVSTHAHLATLVQRCSMQAHDRRVLLTLCVSYEAFAPLCALLARVSSRDIVETWHYCIQQSIEAYAAVVLHALLVGTGERASHIAHSTGSIGGTTPFLSLTVERAVQRTVQYYRVLGTYTPVSTACERHMQAALELVRQHRLERALGFRSGSGSAE